MPDENNAGRAKPGSRLRELGLSNLFVQPFDANAGHVRVVRGVHSVPVGIPVMVQTIFETEWPA